MSQALTRPPRDPEHRTPDDPAIEPQRDRDAGPARRAAASSRSGSRAYDRRERRVGRISGDRLRSTGAPIRAALARAPFVLLVMALLAGGVVGVLWLNTMSDENGVRADRSRQHQAALQLEIEAAQRDVASLGSIPRIAAAAAALGLVPAGGDPAMIVPDPNGGAAKVYGTPTPVPEPASVLAAKAAQAAKDAAARKARADQVKAKRAAAAEAARKAAEAAALAKLTPEQRAARAAAEKAAQQAAAKKAAQQAAAQKAAQKAAQQAAQKAAQKAAQQAAAKKAAQQAAAQQAAQRAAAQQAAQQAAAQQAAQQRAGQQQAAAQPTTPGTQARTSPAAGQPDSGLGAAGQLAEQQLAAASGAGSSTPPTTGGTAPTTAATGGTR
ncbi:hypothetical protein [Nakamurella endophytica]|uniref:Uncharacterized protein n=1 Tax=Nakamurella endophytica TaxID=1748367 RepID=A0A917WK04_9ACTN|nr:hypothetical protein [Nakamurella endophytica]GGM11532.1 hypothetical protein GCM10011594_34310 [Nakamurella endophytica]